MDTEYKQKSDLPDLYQILGLTSDVCKDPKCNEIIKKAYIKKAKICHPDKHPGRNDVIEIFELITDSYNILGNDKLRSEYNNKLSLDKQSSSDFLKLKKHTTDYVKAFGDYVPATSEQKLDFKEKMKLLDSKNGYDASLADITISQQDAKKILNQMSRTRAEQDVELKPEKLFNDGRFDPETFNAVFDKYHNKSDKSITQHNGVPMAWNDMNNTVNFSSFDNLDNLYVDTDKRTDTSRQNYANIDFGQTNKVSKSDIKNIPKADYVHGHKNLEENYYQNMKAKLNERKSDASKIDSMKYNDFNREDTAGYGIFDQLGYKFDDRLELDIDNDIAKKFDKLMSERQQQLLPDVNKSPVIARQPRGSR